MIAIVISYYNRLEQLKKTLLSIANSSVKEYIIIIVDDASSVPLVLQEKNVHVIRLSPEFKTWTQQDVAVNTGCYYALNHFSVDKIIIQSPECYHEGDVLKYVEDNLTDNNYLTMSCYSINKENTFCSSLDITNVINKDNHIVGADMQNGWYNHPIYRPVYFEFCAAISTSNLVKLNGYDERLSEGIAFNDDYFLHRIKLLKLIPIIVTDVMVIHQWHETSEAHNNNKLIEKNRAIYHRLLQKEQIKALHIFTPNL